MLLISKAVQITGRFPVTLSYTHGAAAIPSVGYKKNFWISLLQQVEINFNRCPGY